MKLVMKGGCDVEKSYAGPKLPFQDGKFSITIGFIREMLEWFKQGKTLPRRFVSFHCDLCVRDADHC